MIEQTPAPATLQDLKAHLHGELISPNDCGYDANRTVWNGMIEKYPALIVLCADVADVISAVQLNGSPDDIRISAKPSLP